VLQRPLSPVDDLRAAVSVYQILRSVRPAILHTHTAKAGSVGRLAAAFYNRTGGAKVRVVHTYHGHVLDGYFGSMTTQIFTEAERQLARATDAIVAISPQIRTELLEEHRIGLEKQYHVIPLGFDLRAMAAVSRDEAAQTAARAALALPAGAHVVTTVGRLTAIKAHQLFLEAAHRIAARDAGAVFLIVGDGELRSVLEASARTLGLSDRTRFLGWRGDLAAIYGATDVFLLTSRNEGTPVALIESLAAGAPAVSTDVGGVRDVIDGDGVGLLAPFGDADALASRTLELLADPARRRLMGEQGRRAMLARYTLDRLLDDMERLYRSLVS